jgi:hypothetical protein
MDMLQVFKDQNSSQFHSVVSEPALQEEEEEEVKINNSDDDNDNPDLGYGGSSPQ